MIEQQQRALSFDFFFDNAKEDLMKAAGRLYLIATPFFKSLCVYAPVGDLFREISPRARDRHHAWFHQLHFASPEQH